MINNNQLIEFIAEQAGLTDITVRGKTIEYVRARAVAIKLLTERGLGRHETARLLKREPKTIRHALLSWSTIWADDISAVRLYHAGQAALAD